MKVACRIKPIAPPTLVALALVMAVGAPVEPIPRTTAVEQVRVLREDRDGEQVTRFIKAVNAASHKVQPRCSHPAMSATPRDLVAALRFVRPAPDAPAMSPPASRPDGRLHQIDLPPPAPRV